jgi:hypothetical protein
MRIILSVLVVLLWAAPALAADPAPFTASYGLYTGGVHMITVDTIFDLQPKAYEVHTDAKTIGIFSKLLPWSGKFDTRGENPDFRPLEHNYTVSWRGNVETSTFYYQPAGTFKNMTLTKKGATVENPVGPEIAQGTRDLLSTIMIAFKHFEDEGSCAGQILTFDNARSFYVKFTDAGNTMMDNPKISSYQGPAHGCAVEIIPQKGKWPKKPRGWLRIQQQAGNQLPILWLARPRADLPAIPVRVDIHTKYGDVIAHLTGIQ